MKPLELLVHEHDVILGVLDKTEKELRAVRQGAAVDADKFHGVIDFIRNFADYCHHAKEEKILFVKMEKCGIPRNGGPIAVMLMEHDQGRAFVRAAADAVDKAAAGDASARETVVKNLGGFIDLLRSHISKENNILYPMADQVLSEADQAELAAAFERVEKEEIGESVHEKYYRFAEEL